MIRPQLLAGLRTKAWPPTTSRSIRRYQSTAPRWPSRRKTALATFGAGVGLISLSTYLAAPTYLESPSKRSDLDDAADNESLASLLRSYIVYTACAIPALVDHAPQILSTVQSIPIVKQLSGQVIRYTFFDHFVGGETALETIPILDRLRRQGTGALLAYSVEVEEKDGEALSSSSHSATPPHKAHMAEIIRSIDASASFEAQNRADGLGPSKTWTAIKLTALLPDAGSIERFSTWIVRHQSAEMGKITFPHSPASQDLVPLQGKVKTVDLGPMSLDDVEAIKELYGDLRSISIKAKQNGVTLIFDAEHSWYTPAIDAMVLALTKEFNRPSPTLSTPLIYGTYQSYLRRGVPHIQACIADAKREGYTLGIKLVRGAYQTLELNVWKKRTARGTWAFGHGENEPPVWTEKRDTDETYNRSAELIVASLKNDKLKDGRPVVGVLFGTHNTESCELILNLLVKNGLATSTSPGPVALGESHLRLDDRLAGSLTFGQLYGMRDELTTSLANTLTASLPVTLKYVPYGSLDDVIPYLARRAIENKSVLGGQGEGGAAAERKLVSAKLKRKLFGWWGASSKASASN